MTEDPIDPQRLAALMEGRLGERERAEVVARLGADDAILAAYADALAVTRELEEEDTAAAAGAIPLRPAARRAWWGRPAGRLALAAGIAGLALAGSLLLRASGPGADDPGRFAALLEAPGIPAGWERTPWSATRGDAGDPLTPQARAVRLGARVTELEAAVRARDPLAAQVAAEIRVLLRPLPAAGPAAAVYAEIERRAGEGPDALAPLLERGREAVALHAGDEEGVALGAWAQAARIAARGHDAAFFRAKDGRRALAAAERRPRAEAAARAVAADVASGLRSGGDPGWSALERDLDALLAALGN